MPGATGEEPGHGLWFRQLVDRERHVRLVRVFSTAKSLDLDRLDLDWLVRARKAEALAMHRLESAFEFSERAERQGQRAVGAEVTEMGRHSTSGALARLTLASE